MMDKLGERVLQDKHDLTLSQFFVLAQMVNGRQCQRELADGLGVTPAAISRHVSVLMKRGYLERTPHDADKRYGFVEVSAAGRDVYRDAAKSLTAFFDDKYRNLTDEQKQRIDQSLSDLADCFCKNEDKTS